MYRASGAHFHVTHCCRVLLAWGEYKDNERQASREHTRAQHCWQRHRGRLQSETTPRPTLRSLWLIPREKSSIAGLFGGQSADPLLPSKREQSAHQDVKRNHAPRICISALNIGANCRPGASWQGQKKNDLHKLLGGDVMPSRSHQIPKYHVVCFHKPLAAGYPCCDQSCRQQQYGHLLDPRGHHRLPHGSKSSVLCRDARASSHVRPEIGLRAGTHSAACSGVRSMLTVSPPRLLSSERFRSWDETNLARPPS